MKGLAILLLVGAALAKHEEYAGWKSYFVGPQNIEQLRNINSLAHEHKLDFLKRPIVGRDGLLLVSPQQHRIFTQAVENWGIPYRVHVQDVVQALKRDDEAMETARKLSPAKSDRSMTYDKYQTLDVIYNYIEEIARTYPRIATLVEPNESFDGTPLRYLKISSTNFEDTSKPIMFIEATIHAREWIAPPVVTWAIHKLVENVTEPDLLERFDWILMPVSNPDGYNYSHNKDRFWRKTRSVNSNILSSLCPGADANRNYDFEWNTVGVDWSPCSEIYPGGRVFSEVESRVIRDILRENLKRMAMFITMHSFGSMIIYPWCHNGTLPKNALELQTVGDAMADKIYEHSLPEFPRYVVGNGVSVIEYASSGTAIDYAYSIGVPFTFAFELPGLEGGYEGFNLDPRYISHIVRETWEGIVAGARQAGDLYSPVP